MYVATERTDQGLARIAGELITTLRLENGPEREFGPVPQRIGEAGKRTGTRETRLAVHTNDSPPHR